MKPNPFSGLLHSRKFWLLFLNVVISIVSLFITNHLDPDLVVELLAVIGILQPLWIMVIKGITDEDVAKLNNTEDKSEPQQLASVVGFPLPDSFEVAFPDDD